MHHRSEVFGKGPLPIQDKLRLASWGGKKPGTRSGGSGGSGSRPGTASCVLYVGQGSQFRIFSIITNGTVSKTHLFDHSQRRCNHQDAQCILGRQIGYETFARLCGTSELRPPSCRNVKQREVADSWESQPSCLPVSAELIHVQLRSVLLIPSRQQPDFLCFLQHGEDFFLAPPLAPHLRSSIDQCMASKISKVWFIKTTKSMMDMI